MHSKSFYRSDYLYHHGILGQRWGKRNGPPYPLDAEDHSASEKKAGWKKSLDKSFGKEYNKSGKSEKEPHEKRHLTDKQKRAIKIGAAVAVTALAAVGTAYLVRSGKLDKLAELGKDKVNGLLGKGKNIPIEGINDGSFRKLPHAESLNDTLRKTNPLRGKPGGDTNCTACGFAAFLRRKGYDVTARVVGDGNKNLTVIAEKCVKNYNNHLLEGSAVKFGRSRQDAAEMLLKRYGNNAEGVCSIIWKNGNGGHAFNWVINNGIVSFFDAQNGLDDSTVSKLFWERIDPSGALNILRLDNAEIDFEALRQFVN